MYFHLYILRALSGGYLLDNSTSIDIDPGNYGIASVGGPIDALSLMKRH